MEKTTEEKLEEYKEHSKNCALCGKESLFDGCSMQLVSLTETGQVINPYDNDMQGASVMVPMCAYHMVLSQEGLIAMTTQNQIIQSKLLTQLEPRTDEELNKFILKLGRAKKDELNKAFKNASKTILNARKFQKDMNIGIEQAKEKLKNENPKTLD